MLSGGEGEATAAAQREQGPGASPPRPGSARRAPYGGCGRSAPRPARLLCLLCTSIRPYTSLSIDGCACLPSDRATAGCKARGAPAAWFCHGENRPGMVGRETKRARGGVSQYFPRPPGSPCHPPAVSRGTSRRCLRCPGRGRSVPTGARLPQLLSGALPAPHPDGPLSPVLLASTRRKSGRGSLPSNPRSAPNTLGGSLSRREGCATFAVKLHGWPQRQLASDFQTNTHLLKAEPRRKCEEGLRCGRPRGKAVVYGLIQAELCRVGAGGEESFSLHGTFLVPGWICPSPLPCSRGAVSAAGRRGGTGGSCLERACVN